MTLEEIKTAVDDMYTKVQGRLNPTVLKEMVTKINEYVEEHGAEDVEEYVLEAMGALFDDEFIADSLALTKSIGNSDLATEDYREYFNHTVKAGMNLQQYIAHQIACIQASETLFGV